VKAGIVVLAWGVFLASSALTAILQGVLVPARFYGGYNAQAGFPSGIVFFYVAIFGVSILAGIVLADVGRALLGTFASYGFAIVLTFTALSLPTLQSPFPPALLTDVAAVFTFTAFFPLPIIVILVGALLGAGISERL